MLEFYRVQPLNVHVRMSLDLLLPQNTVNARVDQTLELMARQIIEMRMQLRDVSQRFDPLPLVVVRFAFVVPQKCAYEIAWCCVAGAGCTCSARHNRRVFVCI